MRKAEAKRLPTGCRIRWGDHVQTRKCHMWFTGTVESPMASDVIRVTEIEQERRDMSPLPIPGSRYVEFPLIYRRVD